MKPIRRKIIRILIDLAIILVTIGLYAIVDALRMPPSGGLGAFGVLIIGWISIGLAALLTVIAIVLGNR